MHRSIASTNDPQTLSGRESPLFHLQDGGTSVVVDARLATFPAIVHWGAALGDLSTAELSALADAALPQRVSGGLDAFAPLGLVAVEADGWQHAPSFAGTHERSAASARFEVQSAEAVGTALRVVAVGAGVRLTVDLELDSAGLLSQRARVENLDARPFRLERFELGFPLPAVAREILDTTGHHLRERHPQRHALTIGEHSRSTRRGRPGADATLLLAAGTPGFGWERGLVHGVHLGWSGDAAVRAERTVEGVAFLAVGELLRPAEIELAQGESYETPVAYGSWGDGLTELQARFHAAVRARPQHPATPRPVTLNTWEAVYFDHDLTRLTALAERAARIGVERFVLDDGWFLGRRDDTTALGDWSVDPTVWPEGLSPLTDVVTGLGMQFGLWVEPEMISPESELARAHPEWILGPGGHLPPSGRQQQVLDLSQQGAFDHILGALDALLTEYPISYLKWDHNRDVIEAVSPITGRAAVHENVLALYRLLDELRARHPGVEIESCASGGARVDLGILARTDRIWTSDCIDPLERQTIQPFTQLVVPPELMGQHIGGPQSHSTKRTHSLAFRAGTALPGHLGIEWDISRLDPAVEEELTAWVAFHREHRALLHTGTAVRADLADDAASLSGVVAADRSSALFTFAQLRTGESYPPGRITLPGLNPETAYSVRLAPVTTPLGGPGQSPLAWTERETVLSGRVLATVGLQAPVLDPEQLVMLVLTAI
ncbi:alpha-galactosidase [Rathayibacter tanaceti]|uniref:alpha-galactosidase n=2 Tax=Rathayibacter tanaceti TaxID=1671680 RepID=A0A166D6S2_9MICO|nr:alpha-galactosidase [Rathayibacter tanaceti]KZX21977.1 Alpha-galactosidase [Rathayibacter tanaceti]QHC56777.1 alpha-galactosidase [Rathayibacter tanaceti]TCO33749.1 alpha-galactosidase [Rathayibacter tanaceti]